MRARDWVIMTTLAWMAGGSPARAYMVQPMMGPSGQSLRFVCDVHGETFCQDLCGAADACLMSESTCRSCAGTQNIRLIRLLDSIGTTVRVEGAARGDAALIEVLKSNRWMTLHPGTLYNYSMRYDGVAIRARFKRLCERDFESKGGLLLVKLDPETGEPQGVLGALCPNHDARESDFYEVTSSR